MTKVAKPARTAAQKERVAKERAHREMLTSFAEQQLKQSVWYAHSGALREEQERWEAFFVAALSGGNGCFPQTIVKAAQDIADEAMKLVQLREKVKWEECLAEARKNRGK